MTNIAKKDISSDNGEQGPSVYYTHKLTDKAALAAFDNLAHLIAETFAVPVVLLSFVDNDEAFFQTKHELTDETIARNATNFCSHAILTDDPAIIVTPVVFKRLGKRSLEQYFRTKEKAGNLF